MNDYSDYLDVFESNGYERRKKLKTKPKLRRIESIGKLVEPGDHIEGGFKPSFTSSRHEREWILTYLGPFYEDHMISDVLRQVKGGKEATVYCCAAHPSTGLELIAAKVYRPRMFRNLRNDALYRKGREDMDDQGKGVRDRRRLLAIKKKTRVGKQLQHISWLAHEFQTMRLLYEAGVSLPKPIACNDNAILMAYMGDEEMAAPTLNHVTLSAEEAQPLFDRLIHDVDLMLSQARVHADLSAYNVLYWAGEVKIIDFPQAVDPFVNPHAFELFTRDVTRLCQYFARCGIAADSAELATEIWARYFPRVALK